MAYALQWRSPALPYTQKQTAISVPAGATVSTGSSLRFTGKGAANYGKVQQENLMRLLENFAGPTQPDNPTVGQLWYNTTGGQLQVCTATAPVSLPAASQWRSLNATQITDVGDPSPSSPGLGDLWFQRTGSASGILHVFTGLGRYGLGGWEQVWPTVDTAGGRPEYDLIAGLVMDYIGDPTVFASGNGAFGRIISNLTDFDALDASTQAAWTARVPNDINVVQGNQVVGNLKAQPNSNDWDTLLAAGRYALNRLELPPTFVDDVSPVPFVTDGRPAAASLVALSDTDIRYPSQERLVNTRFGMVSLARFYQETYNVLTSGGNSRFLLKGMMGLSGTNPTFAANVVTSTQANFSANATLFSGTITHGLIFNFSSAADLQRYFTAGQAVQVVLAHGATSTAADIALKALTDAQGRIRIIFDNTLVMTPAASPALAQPPTNVGFTDFTAPGVTLATISGGGASIVVRGILQSATSVQVAIDITPGGATTGSFSANWSVINDTETYPNPAPTRVYPLPQAYVSGDKQGSGLFV